ncbi:hypothetical protein F2Q69_00027301 [Brassica cretica]|uniref:Uncharacterized protein n=1 Tax=Brassica cretica TaxID=69181 RepID=A0A8S9S029_BRACR|nr:hypothetical protein F2Q69_00027301 [Brassica cretica]
MDISYDHVGRPSGWDNYGRTRGPHSVVKGLSFLGLADQQDDDLNGIDCRKEPSETTKQRREPIPIIGLATGMGHIDVLVRGWKERSHGTLVCLIESGGDLEFELKRIHETTEQVERLEEPPLLSCLIHKLKRSSAENPRRPETLAVELSLSEPSLSLFSLSSPAPCSGGGGGCAVWCGGDQISFPSSLLF